MLYIGIDLGTSSVKALLINGAGLILGEAEASYPVFYPQTNWAEQNPDDWWHATLTVLNKLVDQNREVAHDIRGIGFSGQMHGMVALDQNGDVLTPAILWCDQRTGEECNDIQEHFGMETLGNLVGNTALTGFTAPKILWLKKNHPEIFEKVKMYLLPKDYINYKLSGVYATDYSDASGMLLLDVKNKMYSSQILDYLGIDESQFPKLHESYEVTGKLSPELKTILGLEQEVIIVAGAGDQAAGAVGTGTVEEGIVSVTLGTSGVVFAAHDTYRMDSENRLHAFCHANGKYHSMGVMLSAASCLKWWSDEVTRSPIDHLLNEVDGKISDIIFLPYLMGERTPYANPDARGTFVGLTMNTGQGEMTRAVLEGVAFGLKDSLDILKSMNVPINEIRLIGGGAKSAIWRQILADVFNHEIVGISTNQGGALGAAILAAVGDGLYETVEIATGKMIQTLDPVLPIHENAEIYKRKHKKYQDLYRYLEPYFSDQN